MAHFSQNLTSLLFFFPRLNLSLNLTSFPRWLILVKILQFLEKIRCTFTNIYEDNEPLWCNPGSHRAWGTISAASGYMIKNDSASLSLSPNPRSHIDLLLGLFLKSRYCIIRILSQKHRCAMSKMPSSLWISHVFWTIVYNLLTQPQKFKCGVVQTKPESTRPRRSGRVH